MLTEADMIVEQIEDGGPGTLRPREAAYIAHGPDGHTWLIKRTTESAARRDGLAYFLSTRVEHEGRWYIKDHNGKPFCDGAGKPFNAKPDALDVPWDSSGVASNTAEMVRADRARDEVEVAVMYAIGTGLRGFRRGTTGVVKNWRITLTLATGEVVSIDVPDCHFEAAAISRAKARLQRGDVVVAEGAVLV